MTNEYQPGFEDLYVVITPMENGMVRFAAHRVLDDSKLYGLLLPAEMARTIAQHLTLASFAAEDSQKWHDDQIGNPE